jgi:hypothetical protein
MRTMTADQITALDQHITTALLNDAIRAFAGGRGSREQAMLLDLLDSPVVDRLAEDEDGIYTDEDGREDADYGYIVGGTLVAYVSEGQAVWFA